MHNAFDSHWSKSTITRMVESVPRTAPAGPTGVPPWGDGATGSGEIVNRAKIGFFSLSHRATSGDDRPYLAWHQLDHMPEQYQLPGMLLGQRWASTPECRAARAVEVDSWSLVEHVVCYLMGDPVDETLDGFLTLGRHLAELGRFGHTLPSQYRGGLRLLEAQAAPRVLVSAPVVPFRPHRGIYLIVEEPIGEPEQGAFLQRLHTDVLPTLVTVPGVAGAWTFATSPAIRRSLFSEGSHRMTVCYLDDDPAAVGTRLAPVVGQLWGTAPARVLLAAPFASLTTTEWERFGPVPD